MKKKERSLMIAGESGMGIESVGEIFMQLFASCGYRLTAEREYASLIKYGQANVNIHVGLQPRTAMTREFYIGLGLGRTGVTHLVEHLLPGGYLLYNFEKIENIEDLLAKASEKNLTSIHIPTRTWLESKHRSLITENTILIGAMAKILQIPFTLVERMMIQKYGKKVSLLEKNIACLEYGYSIVQENQVLPIEHPNQLPEKRLLIDGNTAIALGAIQAGVSCYFAYPMSPSSSILTIMAETAEKTGILVKQVEDEITAAQMTLGAFYAGARAMTATSGGGFDLMTETVSLAGMIEVPLVICIAMRPGPATGLPTWTAQGDLHLAIYSGHGEYARIVIAVSDPESAFLLTQHAHNLAEQFQVPVILLTDKHIAENIQTVPVFPEGPEITRFLLNDQELQKSGNSLKRYEITENGISSRWLPSQGNYTFFCNGDEHNEYGVLDESVETEKMIQKRIRKLSSIEKILPDPIIYGNMEATLTIIGRGSTKNVMMDLLQAEEYDGRRRYVHVEYMWPMRNEFWNRIFKSQHTQSLSQGERVAGIQIAILETNATGQFANLLQQQFGVIIDQRFCKANGRAFYREEVKQRIDNINFENY